MQHVFKQIKAYKISEEIVGQIKSLIKEGKLQPGEFLPPERELSELLGVSRSSLREAINILQTLGFVEIQKRKGAFIKSVSAAIVTDPLKQIIEEDPRKLFELYEFRKDIEMASIYKAALLRKRADLSRMRRHLFKMRDDAKKSFILLDDDLNFHLAIAQATQNFMRAHILKTIYELAGDFMETVVKRIIEKEEVTTLYRQHEGIYEAILERNQSAARLKMERHLTWVIERLF